MQTFVKDRRFSIVSWKNGRVYISGESELRGEEKKPPRHTKSLVGTHGHPSHTRRILVSQRNPLVRLLPSESGGSRRKHVGPSKGIKFPTYENLSKDSASYGHRRAKTCE